MDTDGAHQANRSSPSCLNSGTQRTDFCHGLLGRLRNSHAHFRAPGAPRDQAVPGARPDRPSFMDRVVEENALGTALLAKDARSALLAMAQIVKRQSGYRVALARG